MRYLGDFGFMPYMNALVDSLAHVDAAPYDWRMVSIFYILFFKNNEIYLQRRYLSQLTFKSG